MSQIDTDVLIIGASLAGAAAAKRTVDAGFRTIIVERKELPRHKICSGILSPRGFSFLRENFGELPDQAFHTPKWVTGVNFLFPSGLQLPMPFIPGPTPHIYRKHADHHVVKASRAEVHERTEFRDIETRANDVLVTARRAGADDEVVYRAKYVVAADGPRSDVVANLYPPFRDSIPGSSSVRNTTTRICASIRSGSTSPSTPRSATTRGRISRTTRTLSGTPASTATTGRRATRRRSSTCGRGTGCRSAARC